MKDQDFLCKSKDYEAIKMTFRTIDLECDKCEEWFSMKMEDYNNSNIVKDGMLTQIKDYHCCSCKRLN